MLLRPPTNVPRIQSAPSALASVVIAVLAACSDEGSADRQSPIAGAPPAVSATGQSPAAEAPQVASETAAAGEASANPAGGQSAEFELAWQDDFDTFDASRWQLMTHSWDTNLAQFSAQNVAIESGIAALRLTAEPSDPLKPFRGVEMRSIETLTYGKVEASIRLARGSGVVSSLVLIYTPWPADDWNELDIEYLGRYSDRVQFNSMVYLGPPAVSPVVQSVSPTQYPQLATIGFDPAADFHVYAMEWTASEARFSIDGQTLHRWNTEIGRLKLPMNILLTIWASSAADWAGAIDASTAPVAAEYDWLKVYRWVDGP
jgi:endo-1,3-1,4-beta-glycanase ExoK